MTMKAETVSMTRRGGPDVMEWVAVDLPAPGPGQIRIRHTAVGVNFLDTMQRSGAAPIPLPSGLGHEAAGIVEAIGPGETDLVTGQRVIYANAGLGAYATARIIDASRAVPIPDAITDEDAVAVVFKGLTAWYLCHRTYRIERGDVLVVHSAAGGVGRLLAAWANALGARVIGTVGSEAKTQTALDAGCHAVHVSPLSPNS